jgi:tagatose 1,6-diphosphate aldolase
MMPVPPDRLAFEEVTLRFAKILPGDPPRGLVPAYHYRILTSAGADAGHINFRLGDTPHVLLSVGHIGFEITEGFRGHGYARQACRAIAPFVRSVYRSVTITCDPGNQASRRTIERIGARFIDEVTLPPDDPQYQGGSRIKRRYQWTP